MEDATLQNLYIEFLPHYKITHLIPGAAKCHHKFVLVYATKANADSRHIAPLFLTMVLDRDGWSTSHPGNFAPSVKSPQYPFNKSLGGPQTPAWVFWRRDKSISLARNQIMIPQLSNL